MRLKRLSRYSFVAEDIGEGDLIPASGNGAQSAQIRCDFDNISPRFVVIAERVGGQHRIYHDKSAQLEEQAPDMDPALLSTLQIFAETLADEGTFAPAKLSPGQTQNLSGLMGQGHGGDMGAALMAYSYLKSRDIEPQVAAVEAVETVPDAGSGLCQRVFVCFSHEGDRFLFDPIPHEQGEGGIGFRLLKQIDKNAGFPESKTGLTDWADVLSGQRCLVNTADDSFMPRIARRNLQKPAFPQANAG